MKKSFVLIVGLIFILMGCSEDNTDTPTETGIAIPDVSVNCTTATDAACDVASNGMEVYVGWSTSACASFDGSVSAVNVSTLTCAAGACDAANSGSWIDDESDATITTMVAGSTTAIAWLNIVDNGASDSDGPQSGDVFCCLDDQASDATLTDASCNPVP